MTKLINQLLLYIDMLIMVYLNLHFKSLDNIYQKKHLFQLIMKIYIKIFDIVNDEC